MTPWQPIGTAPKDGTYMLLLGDSGVMSTPHRVCVGRWDDDKSDWVNHDHGERFTDDGPPATHWMKLPEPPETCK